MTTLWEALRALGSSGSGSLAVSPVLLPYLAGALTALASGLHHRRLKARFGDWRGVWLYFALFFLLLAALPAAIVCLTAAGPADSALAALGLRAGRWRLGLPVLAAALPLVVLIGAFASRSPVMSQHYPLSRSACSGLARLLAYEAGYVALYYTGWEFLYRGLLFFPILDSVGFLAAASLSTALSVLHHIGQPDSELVGALVGGFVFCALAALTGSILYPMALHAALGVSNDVFLCLRVHRGRGHPA